MACAQEVRQLDPMFLSSLAVFMLEQEQAHHKAAVGTHAADLVTFVEFQRKLGVVLKSHREVLTLMTRFWTCLAQPTVQLRTLELVVSRLAEAIDQADRIYRCGRRPGGGGGSAGDARSAQAVGKVRRR